MFGYLVSSCFMYPIQVFWFVSSAVAETIAICPVSCSCLASRSTSMAPIACDDAWLMNRLRQVGASESYVTTAMPFFMADSSVGHSAVGSVAEMTSAFAPLLMSAWMTGSWDEGVSAVPLVSAPVSPSVWSAASAPPVPTLSAVVKYEFPRFFGITKTFRPVLRPPDELEEADAPDDDGGAELDELEDDDDEQAASRTDATTGRVSHALCLSFMSESFQ